MEGIGGYMWLIINVLMVAVLAIAILWGTHQWRQRRRDRAAKKAEEQAIDRVYHEHEDEPTR
jgi:uncharacterized iron-regulated membrane protein